MRQSIFKFIIIVFSILHGNTLLSQQYYFANYSINDGLSHSCINSIIQGKDGYLWIGTNMGVSRFDGHVFKNFTVKNGLSDNKVTTVLEINNGEFLFGHENGHLSYFKENKFEKIVLGKDTRRIFCLSKDKNGCLWIGTQSSGVFKVKLINLIENLKNANYEHYDAKKGLSRDVTSVLYDSQGELWFVTDLGIKKYNSTTSSFDFYVPNGIDFVQFSAIAEDENKDLWFGTPSSGAFKYSRNINQFTKYNLENGKLGSNFVSVLQKTKNGGMYIGTWGGGVSVIKNDKVEILQENNGLSENKIRSISEDREGNLWIGTNQNGLSCFRGQNFKIYNHANDKTNNQIGAICSDANGNMWFGSTNCIYVLNKKDNEFNKFEIPSEEDVEVTTLLEDKRGLIWVGTWGAGIFIIHPQNMSIEHFQGKIPNNDPITFNELYVHTIYQAKNGNIWISMLRGLAVYDSKKNQIHTYTVKDGLADNSTTDIQEDKDGSIWIGSSSSGLTLFKNNRFTILNPNDINIYPSISALTLDENKDIWIATEGGGIYKYFQNKFINFNVNNGFISNYIGSIESDLFGKIWFSTNKGICSWDKENKTFSITDKYDKIARIETKSNSSFRDSQNHLWFGTINGAIEFTPNDLKTNSIESVTQITTVKSFQDTLLKDGLSLNYKKNYLTFMFNGICFSDPEKVRYKYQLEGFDQTWQESELNFATYNNLEPGKYIFHVKSCNNDGLWNSKSVDFSFYITPPFWMTWWFYTSILMIVIFLIIFTIKYREKNLILEKKRLELIVHERTSEIFLQKNEIEKQRDELRINSNIIEHKNLSITDSIRYARRIQLATLPYNDVIFNELPESFILYKPKDIVSGDFYAFAKKENTILIAVADCTGHGVPGAFMSMIGTNLFNQVINEKNIYRPSEILNHLDKGIERALKQEETDNHDGMDIIICSLNFDTKCFEMAGANRPLWLIRKNKSEKIVNDEDYLQIIRPDKNPIGGFHQKTKENFTNHSFNFEPGDTIYLFTDGYADQFGGPKGKKLLSKRLRDYLLEIKNLPIKEQEVLLENYFEKWRGDHEQVDDVLIIGIRYPEKYL
ncbi:MAG: two-component regulator propeller domain-containing protein [Bacteroidota bacterium]